MNNDEKIKEYKAHKTPVPSYEEWMNAQKEIQKKAYELGNLGYKIKNQRKEIERQIAQNAQLKDLLKEIRLMMSIERDFASGHFEKSKLTELLTKIDEVLNGNIRA